MHNAFQSISKRYIDISTYALLAFLFVASPCLMPLPVSAHEVYVLDRGTIEQSMAAVSPNPFSIIGAHGYEFAFWGLFAALVVSTVFAISVTRRVEDFFRPYLVRLKSFAPLVGRLTLGLALVGAAQGSALFGPELPLSSFGAWEPLLKGALYGAGGLIVLGLFTRGAVLAGLAVFIAGIFAHGFYMLTYADYFGLLLYVGILGGGPLAFSLGKRPAASFAKARRFFMSLEPYAYSALRALFGAGVFYAAFYAKFLHSELALQTVLAYHLTVYFPFDPLFIVLGAFIIESLAGLFFIFGFELRHTALFLLFWLTLSFLYFGEAVWPHLILFGINIVIIMRGYDRYSVGSLFARGRFEPVL